MRTLTEHKRINEAIDDNLYWKLDQWFGNDDDGKQNFINVVSHCRKNKPNKETVGFLLDNIKVIKNFLSTVYVVHYKINKLYNIKLNII